MSKSDQAVNLVLAPLRCLWKTVFFISS